MEATLAQVMSQIVHLKFLVTVEIVVMGAVLVSLIVMILLGVRTHNLAYRRSQAEMFKDSWHSLMEEEKYEELIDLCKERIAQTPGDAWAHYYAANAYYRIGEMVKAKEYFVVAREMEPLFLSHVDNVLEEIEMQLGKSKPKGI